MQISYRGERLENLAGEVANEVKVVCDSDSSYNLPHLVRHSPDGFNWGYAGSGPADLARCILIDLLGADNPLVELLYQQFKFAFVVFFGDEWSIERKEIETWIKGQKADVGPVGNKGL